MQLQQPNGTFKHVGNVLMIKGNIAMCNYHYVIQFLAEVDSDEEYKDRQVRFIKQDKTALQMSIKQFLGLFGSDDQALYEQDAVFFKMPRELSPFRDISDKFIPYDKLQKLHHIRVYARTLS